MKTAPGNSGIVPPQDAHATETYRADIDGLRAVAVIAVIVYHLESSFLPGGFIGVDVFFVISGFLITGIILRDLARGRFTLAGFYSRRIRRIFPALIVVLASVLFVSWWVLMSNEFRSLGKHTQMGGVFVSNIAFWNESGYFDQASELKPLLHLWSLGVEEQFYLIWPILLVVVCRLNVPPLLAVGGIALASFVLNIRLTVPNPAAAFYLPFTRFWELMVGAGLACAARSAFSLSRRASSLAAWTGAASISFALFSLTDKSEFPGWWALLPVLGAGFIILAGPEAWLNRTILSNRLVVFVGLISYPLYLWHWPGLSLLRIVNPWLPMQARFLIVCAAVLLAVLTYRFVERPLRHSRSPAAIGILVGLLLVLSAFGTAVQSDLVHGRLFPYDQNVVDARTDWLTIEANTSVLGMRARKIGLGANRVVVVGDSNAEQYYPRIEKLVRERHAPATVTFITDGGCPALPRVTHPTHGCPPSIERLPEVVAETGATQIIIASLWGRLFSAGYLLSPDAESRPVLLDTPERLKAALDLFEARLSAIRSVKVHLVLDIPAGPQFDPIRAFDRLNLRGSQAFRVGSVPQADLEDEAREIYAALRSIGERTGAHVIDPLDQLCPSGECRTAQPDGNPTHKDATHLRASFVRDHVRYLDGVIMGTDE